MLSLSMRDGPGAGIAHDRWRHAAWIALWPIGLGAGAAGLALALTDARLEGHRVPMVLSMIVGLAFVAGGLLAQRARPGGRIAPLMVAVGLYWTAGLLLLFSHSPLLFTAGIVLKDTWIMLAAYFLLSFPESRPFARTDAVLLAPFVVAAVPLELLWLLFFDPGPPGSVLMFSNDPGLASAIDWVQRVIYTIVSIALALVLALRWRAASPPVRRTLTPVLAGAVTLVVATGNLLEAKIDGGAPSDTLRNLVSLALIAVPLALWADMLRARLARSAVADLVLALHGNLEPGELRDAIARALGDPSLRLAYWLADFETYAELDGTPLELPGDEAQVTRISGADGEPVAVMLHDASLRGERARLEAVGAAAGLALERARLHAELHVRVEELRGTRVRIVEAAQSERKRIERDLHDGAQQRLVALAIDLRRLESRLGSDDDARHALEQARGELTQSLAELRELARGLHPALLSDRGLPAALESLAARAPVPVKLDVAVQERLPETVESAAYFLVAESLTNVAKYAHASGATVQVTRDDGRLVVDVADDGIGGAAPERGSGLRGLSDRVAALGGSLEVTSPAGAGTHVHAELPCG